MRPILSLPPQIRIYGLFFLYSMGLGGIYPRIGDLQLAMGIEEGALGLALTGAGLGTFLSLTFAHGVIERVGGKNTLLYGIIGMAFAIAGISLAPGPLQMFICLFVAGALIGGIEVVVNVEADRTEHLIGRRIMSRCHAFWSFGFFSAGLVGAFMKQAQISPQVHLFAMAVIVTIGTILFAGGMQLADARTAPNAEDEAPRFATPTLGIMALVAFTLSSMFLEGAGSDWSVIFMRDVFEAAPFINGLAFAIGALAQAIARFFADGFVERFGTINVARFLVLTLCAGTLVVVFAPAPMIALLGFAMIGLGTSAMFPLAMSVAAQRTDRPAAINVAALAQTSFVAFLLGPPLLGFIAEHFGLRYTFAVCLPLVLVSWFAIRALSPKTAQKMEAVAGE